MQRPGWLPGRCLFAPEVSSMHWLDSGDWLVRTLLQRGMATIYLIAFVGAYRQFRPLLGERGLTPIPEFLAQRTFWQAPSLFHLRYSDKLFEQVCLAGCGLSVLALSGILDSGPAAVSILGWLTLWALYTSIVNVGQRFYGFGWESMLLEAGFFTAFLGPSHLQPSWVPILALRWMLFRTELGAGLIKLRHDPCWRDLTCLDYHYETQPMPNPLSWHFHHFPPVLHRAGVLGSHFVQVVAPFGLFLPQPIAGIAGAILISQQLWLIVSGNYAWLNWLTVVLGFSAFGPSLGSGAPRPLWLDLMLPVLAVLTLYLSKEPLLNLLSKQQKMNFNYNVWRLVNAYGAFGSVTRTRYELVLEGTSQIFPTPDTPWKEYELPGKPGSPSRRPPQFAPYHLRLDWLLWFLPLSLGAIPANSSPERRLAWRYESWFIALVEKLLKNDKETLKLFRVNPFPDKPPMMIRAVIYEYRYTTPAERRETGAWWHRKRVGVYLPAYSRL
jgi:hypothetical protein